MMRAPGRFGINAAASHKVLHFVEIRKEAPHHDRQMIAGALLINKFGRRPFDGGVLGAVYIYASEISRLKEYAFNLNRALGRSVQLVIPKDSAKVNVTIGETVYTIFEP